MGVFLAVAERGVDRLQTELVFLNGATGIICNGRCQGGDRNGYGCAIRPHPVKGGVAGDAASMSPGCASATERGADDAQAIVVYASFGLPCVDGFLHLGDGVLAQKGAIKDGLEELVQLAGGGDHGSRAAGL